jgi:tetratricopeptide (TPR) repeat protein
MSLEEGEVLQHDKIKDNYKTILRVYNYGTKADAKTLFPKMDRTIEKSSIAIQKHSMHFGGKEQVKWVAQSYLMMGIAHFYKQDYIPARRVFDFVYNEYKDKPIRFEGLLWLAKTYIQMERPAKAEATLNLLTSKMDEDDFPDKVYNELPLVEADFYLSQENYAAAYPFLERALEINKNRFLINRILFILGQINQKDGDFERATRYYSQLIKRNPDFELAFNARLNLAESYDSKTGNSKAITRLLMKMTRETKNKEFLDQIYYALADVALKDKNDTLAINYLRKSVASSINNNYQKTISSLKVADLFFETTEYKFAKLYYDTAMMALPADFPNYFQIKERAEVLTDIVSKHQIIKEQDSLQTLARMNPDERNAIIDAVIEKYRIAEEERKKREEEEKEAKEAEQVAIQNGMQPGMGRRGGPGGPPSLGTGNGKWYFYNPQALSKGYSEFVRKWGKRQLTDNWRLSDKRQMMLASGDLQGETARTDSTLSDTAEVKTSSAATPYDRAYYLNGLPKTEADFQASDGMILEAYHKLGGLYKESLRDTNNAITVYNEMFKRFPENQYELESWFALYQLYSGQKEPSEVEKYKNLILTKYPDSDYAKVIIDPDYFVKLAAKKGQIVKLYNRTYRAFEHEQYFRVLSFANKAIEEYPDNKSLMPRFLYLRAIALGKATTVDSMYTEMKAMVAAYPQSEVTPLAKQILKTLRAEYGFDGGAKGEGKKEAKKVAKYKLMKKIPFFVILAVNGDKVKINPLKVRISDFDKKYFRLRKLRIKSMQLDNQRVLITIGNFSNKNDAANYYRAIKNDKYVLSGLNADDYKIFPISTKNYPIMYRDKDVKGYMEFMKENYNFE